jgi:putative FmdB family regulatory protein
MPEYDYLCAACGPFTKTRPMARYADPQPCPGCGAVAPRALLSMPALGMMDGWQRRAHATNEHSRHAPKVSDRHPPGCRCCSSKGVGQAASGAKSFPRKRPWMIGH